MGPTSNQTLLERAGPVVVVSHVEKRPWGTAVTFVRRDQVRAEVWQQSKQGGAAVQLTRGDGDVFSYAWAADGKQIVPSRGTVERDALLIHRK